MLRLTVHTKGLEEIKDKLMQASSKAEHTLAIQIRKDTSPYVPALTGSLDTRTRIEGFSNAGLGPGTGGSTIVYHVLPYVQNLASTSRKYRKTNRISHPAYHYWNSGDD